MSEEYETEEAYKQSRRNVVQAIVNAVKANTYHSDSEDDKSTEKTESDEEKYKAPIKKSGSKRSLVIILGNYEKPDLKRRKELSQVQKLEDMADIAMCRASSINSINIKLNQLTNRSSIKTRDVFEELKKLKLATARLQACLVTMENIKFEDETEIDEEF